MAIFLKQNILIITAVIHVFKTSERFMNYFLVNYNKILNANIANYQTLSLEALAVWYQVRVSKNIL